MELKVLSLLCVLLSFTKMAKQLEINQEADSDPGPETRVYKSPISRRGVREVDAVEERLVLYMETLERLRNVLRSSSPNVRVLKMVLMVKGRPDVELDLTGNLALLKNKPFTIKEGAEYRIKLVFIIQNEIVSGLRYHQVTYRKGIRVDKQSYMVGSYGPKQAAQSYTTPVDEAPKGMLARGHYKVKSKLIDDDKNVYLEWEWAFDIKKNWD